MSGPKGYNAVLSEQLRRERELLARRRTWNELVAQATAAQAEAIRAGATVDCKAELHRAGYPQRRVSNPSTRDLDQVDAFARVVAGTLARSRAAANTAIAADVNMSLSGLRGDLESMEVTALSRVAPMPLSQPIQSAQPEPSPVEKRAARLIALLPETGCQQRPLSAQIAAAMEERLAERAWLALARKIADAVRAEQDRVELRAAADALLTLVARLTDDAARQVLTGRIEATASLVELDNSRAAILASIAESERRAERAFILEQAAQVWRELGYEVDEDFTEIALDGAPALLRRPGWPQHALQVRFAADRAEIATNVVSLSPTSAEREREIEEDHCASTAGFAQALDSRGVDATRVRAAAAGVLPMQSVAGSELQQSPSKQTRRRETQRTRIPPTGRPQ